MIDTQSPAFIAACEAFRAAFFNRDQSLMISLADGIAAHEKALWSDDMDMAPRDGRYILAFTGEAPNDKLRPYAYRAFVVRCVDPGTLYESWSLRPGLGVDASFFTRWRPLTPPEEV